MFARLSFSSLPPPVHTLAFLRERHGPRYRWLLLLTVMSSTIINVGIPDMSRHFSLGQDQAQWVASGFMAAMTVSMLTTPWLLARRLVLVAWAMLGRLGLGFILPPLNLGALRGTPTALIPQGVSAVNFVRMLGGAAGLSLCGVVLEWRLVVHAATLHGTGAPMARLAAFNDTFLTLAVVCGLALVAAWRMRAKSHTLSQR